MVEPKADYPGQQMTSDLPQPNGPKFGVQITLRVVEYGFDAVQTEVSSNSAGDDLGALLRETVERVLAKVKK